MPAPFGLGGEPRAGIEPASRPYQGRVLPLNYLGFKLALGIEPSPLAYEASAPPVELDQRGAPRWNRTTDEEIRSLRSVRRGRLWTRWDSNPRTSAYKAGCSTRLSYGSYSVKDSNLAPAVCKTAALPHELTERRDAPRNRTELRGVATLRPQPAGPRII